MMRNFLLQILLSIALPCLSFAAQNQSTESRVMEEEVSANEDLMREHGVLNRLLLIPNKLQNLAFSAAPKTRGLNSRKPVNIDLIFTGLREFNRGTFRVAKKAKF